MALLLKHKQTQISVTHWMAGHSMIFCPNKSKVNEQKDDILIHSSIKIFSPNYSPTANKMLMKCTSALLSALVSRCGLPF
jgi:hypothetical protein